ncbi:MAG: glutamate synthase large subunit [Acidobacteriia bacterium]|nr:glutamate synthase large subunit [Terriglobia bacterium]
MVTSVFHGHPDHDSCGTGFIVQRGKPASRRVVESALLALRRLSHRGGVDADGRSGDGAGLLIDIPWRFMRNQAEALGLRLPEQFGVGMMFLPLYGPDAARAAIASLAPSMGLECLGWREAPTNASVLGSKALESLPSVWQVFFASSGPGPVQDLESRLFLFRKRVEAELAGSAYFCSLSSRTIVYKGLLSPWQLPVFYPDLGHRDFESRFAVFHQRFSTNTQPSWSLAQPFRLLAHNGELNTIVGNRRWMHAREPEIRSAFRAGAWFRCLEPYVSDSASLDNAVEILTRQGQSLKLESALFTLVPPAFEKDPRVAPPIRTHLESVAREYEPWDGPAALAFSDGLIVGAKLDRNGLRPLRYTCTADGWLVAGSEVGIMDFDDNLILERHRLGPGEMLAVDLPTGRLLRNDELLHTISFGAHAPLEPPCRPLPPAAVAAQAAESAAVHTGPPRDDPRRIAASLGWSEDQIRLLLYPLAEGKEAVWSMGDDVPPAFMSKMRRTLWDYCKQRFAQVTNPAMDPLREAHVMSLETRFGKKFTSESPVLEETQLAFLREQLAPVRVIDATFPAAGGVAAALEALQRLACESQFSGDAAPGMIVITDRNTSTERAALPALLAAARVWQTMTEDGNHRVPLVVETAQVIDNHHIALLLATGVTAVHPYLALQLAGEHPRGSAANYITAIQAGLRKVLSRMGISVLASYRNGRLFETVGLSEQICADFFSGATHYAEAITLEEILEDYLYNHRQVFSAGASSSEPSSARSGIRDAGLYRYRKDGELHGTSPEILRSLHAFVKSEAPEAYRQFEELVSRREPLAIRDHLNLVGAPPAGAPVPAPAQFPAPAHFEDESHILARFSTQAMSLGAISLEAHRTLALAMNRLGARSNTGEGGEDRDLYRTQPEAVCKTKQVASGRFGVTAEYLAQAEEIEIKIAQGAKPGEGGQLPAGKVTTYIAKLRHAVPGMALISPPPHHDIYSIEDLEQLIHDLREVNPQARIGVKLVAGAGVGVISAGVAKAGANVITISGHDGGTGAASLSSIKNTGLPWELGIREVHKTLTRSGLRSHVRLRVDGGLKFARDIIVAACLGADEFGFGTSALLAIGCVMARQCHLNTCPVGIATQDEALRARFTGNPEMVMAYFQALAAEVRALLTRLGAASIDEITGRTEYLEARNPESARWVADLLQPIERSPGTPAVPARPNWLARQLTCALEPGARLPKRKLPITNADRSIGAGLSGELQRLATMPGFRPAPLDFLFQGTAGQSFGAFLVSGVTLHLSGSANDYVGKGLSGGSIAISAGNQASLRGDVLAGNTVLYGATSGELFIAGAAGERFAVRNSGALAVVEGVGDHGCEYMTGGVVVLLGPAGINFGSGMTGGLAYVPASLMTDHCLNRDFVHLAECSEEEDAMLRQVLKKHCRLTASPRAASLLDSHTPLPLLRVQPHQLPCPVHQIWEPVLRRLQSLAATHESIPAGAETRGLGNTLALMEAEAKTPPSASRKIVISGT